MNSPLAYKPVEQITEADLQELVDDKFIELKKLEYKATLPGGKDEERKEFLADVSSFANALGGDLIFGIGQDGNGAPAPPIGLALANPDAEVLRLDNMIRDGVRRRIVPTVVSHPVRVTSGFVIVIRIPRSLLRPHMVTFQSHNKFYSRSSNGKYPMDVDEIRSAVLMSETVAERIRAFRADRAGRIVAGDTPVSLEAGPKVVLHIVPATGFEPGAGFDVRRLRPQHMGLLQPLTPGFDGERFNLDGLLTSGKRREATAAETYVQVFRTGALESVDVAIMRADSGVTIIPGFVMEKRILEALPRYFDIMRHMGVEPPVFIMLTLLGVKDRRIVPKDNLATHSIDRDALFIPEVLVENFEAKPAEVMRPAFDMMWNASGLAASPHYDDAGSWKSD